MKYLILTVLLYGMTACSSRDYVNEEVENFIGKIELKDFNVTGKVKSITELYQLSDIKNKSRFRVPRFIAAFNEEGKLVTYTDFDRDKDTVYHKKIYHDKNRIKIVSKYDSIVSYYDDDNNLLESAKYAYKNTNGLSYKKIYEYDSQGRLTKLEQYNGVSSDKMFELMQTFLIKYEGNKKYRYRVIPLSKDTISTKEITVDNHGRFLSDGKRTITYDNDKVVQNTNKNTNVIYEYNNDLLIKKTLYSRDVETLREEYFYDDNDNLSRRKEYRKKVLTGAPTFTHVYDDKGNWLEKYIKFDKTDVVVVREIQYW